MYMIGHLGGIAVIIGVILCILKWPFPVSLYLFTFYVIVKIYYSRNREIRFGDLHLLIARSETQFFTIHFLCTIKFLPEGATY